MAVFTNTLQTFATNGIREKLTDAITNIAPTETPFYSMIKKIKSDNRKIEWQNDTLTDADGDNKTIEGDDITTGDSLTSTVRQANYMQLQDKVVIVSDSDVASNTAGRANELKYQVSKEAKALKRDMESALTRNNAGVIGNATTAGELGGCLSWMETNSDREAGGADGGWNSGTSIVDAATNGSQRASTEDQLKAVVKSCWDEGGDPSIIMVGSFQKQKYSAFSGIATQYQENQPAMGQKRAVILGAADVYVSDFGRHRIIPNRFSSARDAYVLDPSKWACAFLQPFKVTPLARTGHAEKRLIKVEHTLVSFDERASGVVADLSTS